MFLSCLSSSIRSKSSFLRSKLNIDFYSFVLIMPFVDRLIHTAFTGINIQRGSMRETKINTVNFNVQCEFDFEHLFLLCSFFIHFRLVYFNRLFFFRMLFWVAQWVRFF